MFAATTGQRVATPSFLYLDRVVRCTRVMSDRTVINTQASYLARLNLHQTTVQTSRKEGNLYTEAQT